ncbi:restriction endonuclease subunit S [Acidocella facilis]|uniref:restriction endonuclease subunit S n=1 Tax=Acidocella facilis TaxID=525 RepID=UPI0012DC6BA2|nr:restriction endonuclease subunit S [Acidocella facilis]
MRAEYRKTDAGVIPKDWQVLKINDVCKLINGRGFKPHEWEASGLPIIRIQNLNGSEDFNFYTGAYDKKIEIEPGQLLFAWSGSRGTSFGPHIWNGPLGLLNYHTWKVVVQEERISQSYFRHALKRLTTFIEERAHGASALVHVQKWEMEGFKFPAPPTVLEQEAIAGALSDADALIESLEQLLTKKRQIKRGAMQELLTGKRRLPGFKGKWITTDLARVCSMKSGQSITNADINWYSEFPCYGGNGLRGYTQTFTHNGQFSLIGRQGALCGNVSFVEGRLFASEHAIVVTALPHVAIKWLTLVLWKMNLNKYSESSAQPGLSVSKLLSLEINCPPGRDEQTAIASVLSDMDAEIAALEEKLTKAKALKQGMMQELLTGRIRLV